MSRPKNAVFLARVPDDFRPTHYHAVPTEILGGEFYARSLPLCRALVVAQEFNKAHLPCTGRYENQWAVVLKGLRSQPAAAREGLAAAAAARNAKGGE